MAAIIYLIPHTKQFFNCNQKTPYNIFFYLVFNTNKINLKKKLFFLNTLQPCHRNLCIYNDFIHIGPWPIQGDCVTLISQIKPRSVCWYLCRKSIWSISIQIALRISGNLHMKTHGNSMWLLWPLPLTSKISEMYVCIYVHAAQS